MSNLKDQLKNGCPLLAAAALGDFMKDVKDIINGETTGLLSSVTLALGTTSAKALKVGANVCAFVGVGSKAKVGSEVAFTADDHDVAAAKFAAFRVSIESTGTITLTKGADQDTEVLALANVPAVPAAGVDLGYIVVTGVFDATTTDLAADLYPATAHVLDAYSELDE